MKIKMEDVQKEGFEIIEEIFGAYIAAPIKLDAVGGECLDNLDYGTYDTDESLQEVDTGNSETYFTLKQDGMIRVYMEPLENIKKYLSEYFETKNRNKKNRDEQTNNLLQGIELERNQPIVRKYLNNDVLMDVWNKTIAELNSKHSRQISYGIKSIYSLIRITLATIVERCKNLDIENILLNPKEKIFEKDIELFMEGLNQIYREDYDELLNTVSIIIKTLNKTQYDEFDSVNPCYKITDDEILEDYVFIQTRYNDPYIAVANDAVIKALYNFESFQKLDFDNKILIADIVINKGYVTDFAFDDAVTNVACHENIMVKDFNIRIEKEKIKQDEKGRYTILELGKGDIDISKNLYKAYLIHGLNWNFTKKPLCFDEFIKNKLMSKNYINNYVIGTLI